MSKKKHKVVSSLQNQGRINAGKRRVAAWVPAYIAQALSSEAAKNYRTVTTQLLLILKERYENEH